MKFDEWEILIETERDGLRQHLDPYTEWGLFKSVEAAVISKNGDQKGVKKHSLG